MGKDKDQVHLDSRDISRYIAGTLDDHIRPVVERHLAECDMCRHVLVTTLRSRQSEPEDKSLWERIKEWLFG